MKVLGLDHRRNHLEVIPGLHTFLGGARISTQAETSIPGLYAAGEAGGQEGIFGADRVGGGIPAAQVMGHRAGKYASLFSTRAKQLDAEERQIEEEKDRLRSMEREKGEDPFEMEQKIKNISLDAIGISRTEKGLKKGLEGYSSISSLVDERRLRVTNVMDLVKAQQVDDLSLTGEMVSQAALLRKESRGAHRREDYPERKDREWLKWITFRREKDQMKIDTVRIPIEKYRVRPEGF